MNLSLIPVDLMEEWASEYISSLKLNMDICSLLEELNCICLDLPNDCKELKKIFTDYINEMCEEKHICKECFRFPKPVVAKEYHTELDYMCGENVVVRYDCECGENYYID